LAIPFLLLCFRGFTRELHRARNARAHLLLIEAAPVIQVTKRNRGAVVKISAASRKRSPMQARKKFALLFVAAGLAVAVSTTAAAQIQAASDPEVQQLRELVLRLQSRIEQLEKNQSAGVQPAKEPAVVSGQPAAGAGAEDLSSSKEDRSVLDFFRGTTINGALDGYYGYNFNQPIGRVNLLRAYDVSSNSFSLNQANLIIERAPDIDAKRRYGLRLDFQYGQATETLQGSAGNELRPQVYRPLFQAYGTYVFPAGSGLTVDFGKWASALGFENNYSKDQINYSRSYFFNFLPFYHMGFRAGYNLNSKVNVTYWLVNGAQQTEDFNGFKSQAFIFTIKPASTVSWNLNYYFGQEQRDVTAVLNPGLPAGPTQPGLPASNITPVPNGREHVFDTYVSWNAMPKLTLGGEADYVINRVFSSSAPQRVSGGAAYARYQLTPKFALAGRGEYLSDRGGLFSGATQALKESTATTEYKLSDGFLARVEWRRDFSNQPFFLTSVPGQLKKEQNTATLGLIWWFGQKQGAW
jgi:putative OmpL-like beta-barrel porin-2